MPPPILVEFLYSLIGLFDSPPVLSFQNWRELFHYSMRREFFAGHSRSIRALADRGNHSSGDFSRHSTQIYCDLSHTWVEGKNPRIKLLFAPFLPRVFAFCSPLKSPQNPPKSVMGTFSSPHPTRPYTNRVSEYAATACSILAIQAVVRQLR